MRLEPRRADRRAEFLQHPSVQALLASDSSTGCPREIMRKRASAAVSKARALGWGGPPFDMAILASLLGIRIRIVDWLVEGQDGCIIPGNSPEILLRQGMPSTRTRFTIGHELAHTLLPDFASVADSRPWEYRVDAQSPVEQLCQVGARELLMPSRAVNKWIDGRDASLTLAVQFSSAFDVSLEATVRNLVDLSQQHLAFVVLQLTNKPSEVNDPRQLTFLDLEEPLPQKRLRVFYSGTSASWDNVFIPQWKSVPVGSAAYGALQGNGGSIEAAEEEWSEVTTSFGRCRVEAVKLRSPDDERVLCLVTPVG